MKHAFKKIMALALAIVMILGVLPAASAAKVGSFVDVNDTDWFAPYVENVVFYDLMNGTSKTTFEPNAYATRAMAVTVLYRFAGEPPVAKASSFTDVKPDYYSNAVAWAESEGIINGMTKTTFEPDTFISREMLATVFWRYSGSPVIEEDCLKSFPDAANVSAYAKNAMNWAVKRGVIGGSYEADGKTYLFPQNYATRAEVAKMFVFLSAALKPCTSHKWDDGVVTKAPTCTEAGEKKQTCSECGATQTVAVPATGHNYVDGVCACGDKLAESDEIVIYYTNDVHTYIDGSLSYDSIADLKKQTAKVAAGTLLLDAGDHIQGTAYGSMDKGESIIEMMNAAGYDAATLGNHEFDYGMERALAVIDEAKFPYLSANFYHEKDGVVGDSVLDAYKIFTVGGKKIAVIGITTPESFTKSTPKYFQDEAGNYIYGIAGGTDGSALYTFVQNAINAAKTENPDYIIALGHLGDDVSSKPWTSEELIANTTGLNAFIDGHSHSTVEHKEVKDKDGKTVVLTQTGSYFDTIGKMTIKDGKISTELLKSYNGSDADVKVLKDAWMKSVDEKLGTVIAHADITLDNYDANGNRLVRKQETNTGDLAADALFYQFETVQGLHVDAAIMNGGGVRNKAITGDISYKTCKDIHTFGNVACLISVTGQQILDALEWGAKDASPDGSKECGGFLQVSGITYEIHTYITSTVQKDDKGVWTGAPTGEYRVKNVTVGGQPLELSKTYNLAGYNYTLRDLGDGFAMFKGAENVLDYVKEDYMVIADYVQSFAKDATSGLPTIKTGDGYDTVTGTGRIKLVNEKPATSGDQTFTKVSSELTDWAGTYVFGYDNGDGTAQIFNGSTDSDGNFVTANITDNKVTVDTKYAIEIAAVDGGYTVKAAGGYMNCKTDKNGISFSDTATTATITWKDGAPAVTASDGRVFAVNHGNVYGSTTENYKGWFRFFKNTGSTITPVVLFKLGYTPSETPNSSSGGSTEEPTESEVYSLTTDLKDGDKVVFVNKANSLAFSTADASSSYYRAGVAVTPEDGKLTVTDTALVWTIETTDGGFFLKNAEGKKLSIPTKADGSTYSSINFAQDTHTVWKITTAATSGCVYLQNTTATGSSGDCKSIEWYAGEGKNYFSTYFVSSSNEALFAMEMYVKGDASATDPTEASTTEAPSSSSGSTEDPVEPSIPDASKSVAIFNIANNKVMTTESYTFTNSSTGASKDELKTADATLSGGKLTTTATNVALFNVINNDGVLTFKTSDGKYLYADGTDVKLVDTEGDNTKFVLESTNSDGTNFYIRCNTANFSGKAQYLEYYANYITCYGLNASNAGIYVFGLYELAESTDPTEASTDPSSSSEEGGDEPAEAEYVALFNPASSKLVTTQSYTFTNTSSSTSKEELELVEGGLIQDETSTAAGKFTAKAYADAEKVALFEVIENEDKTVSFKTKDGKYLYADGTDVKLVDTVSDAGHTAFIKEEVKMTPEGSTEAEVIGYHLKCSKATYNDAAQYLEINYGYLTVFKNTTYTDLENGKPEEDNYLFDLNALHVCEHAYVKDTDKSATASCTEAGEDVMVCSDCKFSYTEEIPASGHKDENSDGKCDNCGEDMPTTAVYTKVTADQTDWSGTYLIAYQVSDTSAYVFEGTDTAHNFGTFTVNNGTIAKTNETAACEVVISKSGDSGYTIQISGGTNAGKYISGTSGSNKINFNTTGSACSISMNGTNVVIKNNNTTFLFYKTAKEDDCRFRFYKSSQQAIVLYKLG